MYKLGCKSGTVYRDGSRDEQVLIRKDDEKATEAAPETAKPEEAQTGANSKQKVFRFEHSVEPLPSQRSGTTISKRTPLGTVHTTSNHDQNGDPFEVFVTIGKAGSDLQADAEAIGRLVSLFLRIASPLTRRERLQLVISQLEGIGGARSVGMGPSRVLSLPDALATTLREMYFAKDAAEQLAIPELANLMSVSDPASPVTYGTNGKAEGKLTGADFCPECGMGTFIRSEGCRKCLSCGYSEC
jgi:ribonucleoside-diphosphate reductase alpha chain